MPFRLLAAGGLALLLITLPGFPQAMDGNLFGTVTDATGAAVPNSNVELENIGTAVKYSAKTDDLGQYRFNNVPIGRYKITVTQSGFTTTTLQNVNVEGNRSSTVNINLQVASVTTAVEVVEAAATIDTTTARLSTSFNAAQAVQLPTTGTGTLGVINLSLMSAGVTSSGGAGYGTGPSVGGQRPTNNNFMIEGVDNNNRSVTGPIIHVSNEAVAEFSLQANQFSPEFGHSTGGQFNTIVRSGTNEVHGSIYEYFQNRNLNAIDEQYKRIGFTTNPRSDQNRLGATIGGPVIKNKLFYFGNLEYLPIGEASSPAGAIFVPTTAGMSQLESLPGLNRRNLDIFKQYVPQPGAQSGTRTTRVSGVDIPLGIFSVSGPAFVNEYRTVKSGDYNISDKDQLRMRWLYYKRDSVDTTANIPTFYTPVQIRSHVASLSEFHNFSPNVLNEFRLAYNRRVEDRPVGEYAFQGLDVFPNLQFNDLGLIIGPNGNYPQGSRSNTFQLVNNINWIKGRHTFKFGYDGRKLNISSFFVQRVRGDYQYNSLERYLLDITPEFAQRSVGGFPFIGNLLSHYAFVNDDIKITPNITLNIGLRYEFVDVPQGAKHQELNAISSVPGVLEFRAPKPTKKDFAPRVGIAWSPGQSGRTSLRAGFGMTYDQIYQNLGTNSLPPQFFTTVDAHIDRANQSGFLASGGIPGTAIAITNPARARQLTASYIPDQLRPYSIQWNGGIQQVLGTNYTLEVRYLGTKGVHLPYQVQLNRQAAITGTARSLPTFLQRPSDAQIESLGLTLAQIQTGFNSNIFASAGFASSITAFTPQGNSMYHGLATQLTKRFSDGLQLNAAYTWSHNIDDSTAALFSTITTPRRPQDFFNLSAEKADSALDRRHRLTFAWLYDAPWFRDGNWFAKNLIGNWVFAGAYTAETGVWATPRSAVDSNLNGDNAGDRTIINPDGRDGTGSAVTALRNSRNDIVGYVANDPSARYIVAGAGVFPTAGRNTLRLPAINDTSMSLAKKFNLTERMFFEFRGEAYNVFNNSQYVPGYPGVANLRSRTNAAATNMLIPGHPNFNRPDLAFQSNSRVLQLVGRFQF